MKRYIHIDRDIVETEKGTFKIIVVFSTSRSWGYQWDDLEVLPENDERLLNYEDSSDWSKVLYTRSLNWRMRKHFKNLRIGILLKKNFLLTQNMLKTIYEKEL